jgi:hypothetical protein
VFPNLIAVATRRKQVSSFLKRSSILSIAQHFGPHFIILPDAVVLSDPSNFGKHSAERSLPVLLRSVKKTAPAPSETHCDAFSVRTSPGLNCVDGCQLVIYFPSTLDSPQEATSALHPIAITRRTWREVPFVPNTDIAGFPSPDLEGGCVVAAREQYCGTKRIKSTANHVIDLDQSTELSLQPRKQNSSTF